jgi:Holliday junction resolvase RusA-like endonuclease
MERVEVVRFTVPCEPVSKGRPRVVMSRGGRPHAFTPDKTLRAEKVVGLLGRAAMRGQSPLSCLLSVDLSFHSSIIRRDRQPDIDNLTKLVLDALNEVIWVDDVQIEEMNVRLRRGAAEPRTEVLVYRLTY